MDAVANEQPVNPVEDVLPKQLLAAAEALAASLLEAEPIAAYLRAKACLDSNEEALLLLERLATVQVELRSKQINGLVTQAEIDRWRALDHQARNNQLIVDYVTTQQIAAAYLAEVNQEISQLLGIDFTAFASSAGC
ncbi:MAG: hypothetical protein DCC55_30185 [Chloroflexi bacterium]|nr:MAG: hypothetical protein DCC55_30185 [Chloroflexota bacterium]